jgi:hypothetical protein
MKENLITFFDTHTSRVICAAVTGAGAGLFDSWVGHLIGAATLIYIVVKIIRLLMTRIPKDKGDEEEKE